jgi:lipid-binding SYLF domain-containing protein
MIAHIRNEVSRPHFMIRSSFLLIMYLTTHLSLLSASKASERVGESTTVLTTILDKEAIPKSVVDKAVCVMVYPNVKKVGIGLGATYGRGLIACRTGSNMTGGWSAPAMFTLDTASLGLQLGSSSTDYVLLIMTQRGADKILSGKLKLGADASAVAGPTGAKASGFNDPNVDILSYSQAKGLFAGAALGGASMASDNDMNKELYGKPLEASQIVRGGTPVPASARALVTFLNRLSPKRN